MANKIKITTTELQTQAARMDALNGRLDDIYRQMASALNKIDNSTCAKFSSNLIIKTASLRRKMQNAKNYLLIGAGVARKCAESYTNADTVIRKNITDINTPEVQSSTPSTQTVSRPGEIKRIGQYSAKYRNDAFDAKLWGKYATTKSTCNVSCCLMAMQQLLGEEELTKRLGTEAWGEAIMNYNQAKNVGTGHSAAYMASYSGAAGLAGLQATTNISLDDALRLYQENPEKYAAPVIGCQYDQGTHYVMVIGKNADGTYQIVDPASANAQTYRYSNNSSEYDLSSRGFIGKLTQVVQYYKG